MCPLTRSMSSDSLFTALSSCCMQSLMLLKITFLIVYIGYQKTYDCNKSVC